MGAGEEEMRLYVSEEDEDYVANSDDREIMNPPGRFHTNRFHLTSIKTSVITTFGSKI